MEGLLLGETGRDCLLRRCSGGGGGGGSQLDLSGHCQHCALEPDKAVLHPVELDLHPLTCCVLGGKPLVFAPQGCIFASEDVETGRGFLEARAQGVVLLALALARAGRREAVALLAGQLARFDRGGLVRAGVRRRGEGDGLQGVSRTGRCQLDSEEASVRLGKTHIVVIVCDTLGWLLASLPL